MTKPSNKVLSRIPQIIVFDARGRWLARFPTASEKAPLAWGRESGAMRCRLADLAWVCQPGITRPHALDAEVTAGAANEISGLGAPPAFPLPSTRRTSAPRAQDGPVRPGYHRAADPGHPSFPLPPQLRKNRRQVGVFLHQRGDQLANTWRPHENRSGNASVFDDQQAVFVRAQTAIVEAG